MNANATSASEVRKEALQLAQKALRDHRECFWMRAPEAVLQSREDVQLVIRRLREGSSDGAWKAAVEIEKCL